MHEERNDVHIRFERGVSRGRAGWPHLCRDERGGDGATDHLRPRFLVQSSRMGGGRRPDAGSRQAVADQAGPGPSLRAEQRGWQPTYRMGDLSNPNLKPWVKEWMKKDNDEVLAGKIGYTARSSCAAAGVPGFLTYPVRPVYFIQTPKQVAMIYSGDAQVRRI